MSGYTAQVLCEPANLGGVAFCGFRAMRPAMAVASPARAVAVLAAVVAVGLAGCTSPPSSQAGHAEGAASTPVRPAALTLV